jgi:outer membrane protein assembly factor BamB
MLAAGATVRKHPREGLRPGFAGNTRSGCAYTDDVTPDDLERIIEMTAMIWSSCPVEPAPAVVPVLIGPLQVLLAILPGLIVAVLGAIVSLLKPRAMLNLIRLLWRLKLPVAAIILTCTTAVWARRSLFPPARGPVNAAEITDASWPIFRGDLARRGIGGSEAGARPAAAWTWKQPQQAFFGSPAVIGNRVYIVSANMNPFGQSGTFYCFDADTGAIVWQTAPEGFRPTFSSPVISGNYLVCGEGLHDTRDARIVCLDARDGRVLWTHRTSSHVECAPVIADGRVYVGAGDDGYYCLDLEGDNGRSKLLWHVPGSEYPDAETSLAVHDGKVYAGLGLGGMALCVLDGQSGRELHRLKMPFPVFGPPAIVDGKLYVGMGNGDYVKEAEQLGVKPGGEVRCIDIARIGEEGYEYDWAFPVGRTVLGAVAVADGHVYFGSRDGYLYSVSSGTGRLAGRWNAHAPIIAAPSVTDRHVYFIAKSGMLYALDRRTMEPVWEFALGKGGRADQPEFISSPAVARGRIFVGSQFDGFFCIPEPDGAAPERSWAGLMGGPGAAGNPGDSPLPEIGEEHWKHPAVMAAPPAALDDALYIPLAGEEPGLACIVNSGEGPAKVRWIHSTANAVHASPAALGALALVVDGRAGDANRHLHAIDAQTGSPRWKQPVDSTASGVLAATPLHLFIQDRPGSLSCMGLDGGLIWTQPVGPISHMPAVADSMLVLAVMDPPALVCLDRLSGRELWRSSLPAAPRTAPIIARMAIFIGTARGIECRSILDGSPQPGWKTDSAGVSGELALARDVLVYVSDEGRLVIISREDGGIINSFDDAVPGLPPVLSRRNIIFVHKDALMTMSLDEPELDPLPWADITGIVPSTPLIVSNSAIFFGTRDGLVKVGGER